MNLFKREVILNWKFSIISIIYYIFVLMYIITIDKAVYEYTAYINIVQNATSLFLFGYLIIVFSGFFIVNNDNKSLFLAFNHSKTKILLIKILYLVFTVTTQFVFSMIIYYIVNSYFETNEIVASYSSIIEFFPMQINVFILYFYIIFTSLFFFTVTFRDRVLKISFTTLSRVRSLLLTTGFAVILYGVHKALDHMMGNYYIFSYSLVLMSLLLILINYDSLKRGEL